jgi:hypothetical protein
MSVPIYLMTCDKYAKVLPVSAFLFNRFWSPSQEVTICGFSPIPEQYKLPDNFKFLSIGNQEDYPVGKWSDGLIRVLDMIDDEVFVLLLDDYLFRRPVNIPAIEMLADYMRQFKYVLKMDLCADRLYAWGMEDYDNCAYIDLLRSHPGSQYHMSLLTGIWNRTLLRRVLIPNESPWQVELDGTTRLSNMTDMLVLGTRQWPIQQVLGFRGGDSSHINLTGLKSADVDDMRTLGIIP